ncbi:MAG: diguanylate cyclase [Pseudomonadota bacterium]
MNRLPDTGVLDVLCPMHLVLSATGHITHAGPTIAKLRPEPGLIEQRFLEVFEVMRPRAVACMDDLMRSAKLKLHLQLRDPPRTSLKGILLPLETGEVIVNLSFGISIMESVRDYQLTNGDFAATDLAIEMLYLSEAQAAVMAEYKRLNARLHGAKTAAEEQAFSDTLTGLRNRRALDMALARHLASGLGFALMHIDLDYFKAVNDTYGHAAGDFVLQRVAEVMTAETRDSDIVARVGGDEFTLILPGVDSEEVLRRIGRRIIEQLEEPIVYEGQSCHISASIGTVRLLPGHASSAEKLLSDADVALYASKNAGRARQTFYEPALREAANAGQPPKGRAERLG